MFDSAHSFFASLLGKLKQKISQSAVQHRQIAHGMLVVASFVLVGKIAGAAKEIAVAWRYGISETVDGYLFVFNLTQWPVMMYAGVVGAVLIPIVARVCREVPETLPCFRAELLGVTVIGGLFIGAVFWLILPWMVSQSWVGLEVGQIETAEAMSRHLTWTIPLGMLFWLFSAWTMAGNRHLNTVLEGVPALAILATVLVMTGPLALIVGTVAGFAIQVILIWLPLVRRGETEKPSFHFKSQHWPAFASAFGVMLVGQALVSLITLVDQFFAAHLGAGAISSLGYANRVLALILGLGATSIGRAALPVLSHHHADGQREIGAIAKKWAIILFTGGVIVSVVVAWLALMIVEILFQRGQFGAGDTKIVADLLRYGLVQVPFYLTSMIFTYSLLSMGRHKLVTVFSGIALLTKVGLGLLLVPALGLKGLQLATAGVFLVSTVLAMYALSPLRESRSI